MSQEMDDLKQAISDENSVIASAVTAFQGIASQIAAAAGDRAATAALATDVRNQAAALAAAIPANTPVANAPGVAAP